MKDIEANRIKTLPTSIFSKMSRLAAEHKAVNLGQGFPDFDGLGQIIDDAYKAMKDSRNQYAPSSGIFSLRKAVSKINKKFYDIDWDAESNITITAGATEALYCSIQAIVNPGDEVIMFEPYYDAHQADVILAGGIPKYVTLTKPDFGFDSGELDRLINPKTKAIILNTPHNPTGKVFSIDELEIIASFAIANDLIVISDEVYEFLTYDGKSHVPIASLPGMAERTITISSTGKTFGMTGWKIGYACANETLTDAIRKVHQWTTFAVNTPAQHAMSNAFNDIDNYLPDFRKTYQRKRDKLYQALLQTEFKPHLPLGSYFIMVDLPEGRYADDIEAAKDLVINHGIATIPPSAFYSKSDEGGSMLRLCFAKRDETLESGIEKLKQLYK